MSLESNSGQVQSFDWQKLMFSFEGRTRRTHFWIGWLILLGVGVVAGWIPILGMLLSLALIWPNTAIAVKRLHDMGQSGWLVLIPWVIGFGSLIAGTMMIGIGAFAVGAMEYEDPATILATFGPAFGLFALAGLIGFAFLLWIGLADSQRGDNRFGPNPKGY
jgi:uncharacterized membrane protein YhaH (DUF805 family)